MSQADSEKSRRRPRVVMDDADKEDVRSNLVRNFVRMGFPEDVVKRSVDAGSLPMHVWMCRWICRETDYPSTREMTDDKFFRAFYAWVHYKATAETLGG